MNTQLFKFLLLVSVIWQPAAKVVRKLVQLEMWPMIAAMPGRDCVGIFYPSQVAALLCKCQFVSDSSFWFLTCSFVSWNVWDVGEMPNLSSSTKNTLHLLLNERLKMFERWSVRHSCSFCEGVGWVSVKSNHSRKSVLAAFVFVYTSCICICWTNQLIHSQLMCFNVTSWKAAPL